MSQSKIFKFHFPSSSPKITNDDKNINIQHPNFESRIQSIKNVNDIKNIIGEILSYEHIFERKTTPWEIHTWDYKDLQEITIDLEKIDRLYDIYHQDDDDEYLISYELTARMDYNNNPLYFKLFAYQSKIDIDYYYNNKLKENIFLRYNNLIDGYIFLSKYPEFFVRDNSIISDNIKNFILNETKNINESLLSLDIPIKKHLNFQSFDPQILKAVEIPFKINGALYCQNDLTRIPIFKERDNWNLETLRKIKINVEQIDRIYFIYFNRDKFISEFEIVARMDYKDIDDDDDNDKLVYVHLIASLNHRYEPKYQGRGNIIVGRNYNFFVKEICVPEEIKNYILIDNKKRKMNEKEEKENNNNNNNNNKQKTNKRCKIVNNL